MLDDLLLVLKWALIALAAAPMVLGIAWAVWDHGIRPRLIPQVEIDRLAQDIVNRHEDPKEAAFIEHQAAWYRSDPYEQGKWLRVRKTIRIMLR